MATQGPREGEAMGQHTIGRRLRAGVGAGAPATSGEVASNDRATYDVLGTPRAWQGRLAPMPRTNAMHDTQRARR